MLFCPNCVNKGYALMDLSEEVGFDEGKQLSIKNWSCPSCKTEIKMIGLICIVCGGSGEVEINNRIYDCTECKGLACHPKFIEIEWNDKRDKVETHSRSVHQSYGDGMDKLRRRKRIRMGFNKW